MGIGCGDELQHRVSEEPLWRESYYVSFHDAAGSVGGMATIGIRPNQLRFEAFSTLFLEGEAFFFRTGGPLSSETCLNSVPGLSCEMLSPLQKWRFRAGADFARIDPHLVLQGIPLPQPTIPGGFDLTFTALSPAYEFPVREFGMLAGQARHYEQNGRVEGTVYVGDGTLNVEGFGFRDHSWGVRDWVKVERAVALFAQFSPSLTVNCIWGRNSDQEVGIGYVSRDGENATVANVQAAVEQQPAGLPQTVSAEIALTDGSRLELGADVLATMPILIPQAQKTLQWYECSARFRCAEEAGYGIVEVGIVVEGQPGDD
jgi:hypothetical protein